MPTDLTDADLADVLRILNSYDPAEWVAGRAVRYQLNNGRRWCWQRWSGPMFYRLMHRMEEAGLVDRWEARMPNGTLRWHYKQTPLGRQARML